VGVDGSWGRLAYEFTVDPQDLDDTLVRDAYGRWRFTRGFQLLCTAAANASVPSQMNVQGRLTVSGGGRRATSALR